VTIDARVGYGRVAVADVAVPDSDSSTSASLRAEGRANNRDDRNKRPVGDRAADDNAIDGELGEMVDFSNSVPELPAKDFWFLWFWR
jgi:hypothetical protein